MEHQFTGVFTKTRKFTEVRPNCEWQASTQLDYHGYFSLRVAAESFKSLYEIPYLMIA